MRALRKLIERVKRGPINFERESVMRWDQHIELMKRTRERQSAVCEQMKRDGTHITCGRHYTPERETNVVATFARARIEGRIA